MFGGDGLIRTIAYLILGYIIPLAVSWKLTRNWMIQDGIKPRLPYVIFVIVPLLNIISLMVCVVVNGDKLAKNFFRIK